ncbi:hypothetical protein [Flavobacterium ajazii]|uniref:hypothetical protein n=1 Tax=Flavobacterium ajazii TaxID=2692318 RepID=UPI0013D263C3|nr:hypothetical protein [Flavobacterium ajazii]
MKKEIRSSIDISNPSEELFAYLLSFNPASVLGELWFMPEADTTFFKKVSTKIGSEKMIYFKDDSTAVYQLFDFVDGTSFSVHIGDFSSDRLKFLDAMRCHYSFSKSKSGLIKAELCFEFKINSRLWTLLFDFLFLRKLQKRLDKVLAEGVKEIMN